MGVLVVDLGVFVGDLGVFLVVTFLEKSFECGVFLGEFWLW